MSVTTVPIQPIEKGSLLKLWGGVGLAALVAAGLAWYGTKASVSGDCGVNAFLPAGKGTSEVTKSATGLRFQTVKAGKGDKPTDEDVVLVNYKGTLAKDGSVFDQSRQPTPFPVTGTIPGFTEALKMMQADGKYRICIPGKLAYGPKGTPDGKIGPNATLNFEVEMLAKMPMAEFQMRMQAAQQAQGGGRGAPPPR